LGTRGLVALGVSGLVVFVATAVSSAASPVDGSRGTSAGVERDPATKLRRTDARLRSLLRRQVPEWSPEGPAQRLEVLRLLESLLDTREMARQALDGRWDHLPPEQRADFVQTLADLAHEAFLDRLAAPSSNNEVHYEAASVEGAEARVPAELTTHKEGGAHPLRARLEYRFARKNGEWMVYDVVVDGVSLVATYRAEFDRFLRSETFAALLKRMKHKLETEPRRLASVD